MNTLFSKCFISITVIIFMFLTAINDFFTIQIAIFKEISFTVFFYFSVHYSFAIICKKSIFIINLYKCISDHHTICIYIIYNLTEILKDKYILLNITITSEMIPIISTLFPFISHYFSISIQKIPTFFKILLPSSPLSSTRINFFSRFLNRLFRLVCLIYIIKT